MWPTNALKTLLAAMLCVTVWNVTALAGKPAGGGGTTAAYTIVDLRSPYHAVDSWSQTYADKISRANPATGVAFLCGSYVRSGQYYSCLWSVSPTQAVGVTDLAGNVLSGAPVVWSFTTAAGGGPPPGGVTVTVSPVADTWVYQAEPSAGHAGDVKLPVVGSPSVKQAFLRFVVSGLPVGGVVESAKLRLTVVNDSTSGGIFSGVSSTSWPASGCIGESQSRAIPEPVVIQEVFLPCILTGNAQLGPSVNATNSNGYAGVPSPAW